MSAEDLVQSKSIQCLCFTFPPKTYGKAASSLLALCFLLPTSIFNMLMETEKYFLFGEKPLMFREARLETASEKK